MNRHNPRKVQQYGLYLQFEVQSLVLFPKLFTIVVSNNVLTPIEFRLDKKEFAKQLEKLY